MSYYTRLLHDDAIISYYTRLFYSYLQLLQLFHIITVIRGWGQHSLSKTKQEGWATHRGYHVGEESQRLDHLVRSLTWTCGSWDPHTVFQPTRCVCDERRWHAVNRTIALKLELNTIQKEENAQPCAWRLMDQWHECARMTSYFSINLNEKQPKCQ